MKFGTWNVRSLYRAGSLRAVAEEILKYKLDLAGAQKVRWDRGGIAPPGDYTFFYGKGNEYYELGTGFFVQEFVSDRISYITLNGRWCDIIVMNVHAPDEIAMSSKNKNIRDLYRGINDLKRGYLPSSNLVKDANGDLLADSHNILNRWRNYEGRTESHEQQFFVK
ncbi:hypothetical protein B7P43_G01314 [Cryptotermes secundus]|uniref:Endonuclease/exonuclease/phosphatase domain-containing protein n=1 Tax=Cryptotermes secundus TaxID=105785 RepID=A0A2J7REC2_9NEOP|nr:hypothetical protein B7P43_G01314 [Cryptotermes secundus]